MSSPEKLTPKRIGVLGAGQLALMLAEALPALASKLPETQQLEVICAGSPGDCAARVAPLLETDLTDAQSVHAFAKQVDLVTVESENIDAAVLQGLNLYPNARAIGIAQDRLLEKQFFHECGIDTAPFAAVDSVEDLQRAITRIGLPAILKTRRMGYDGKGQVRLAHASEAAAAWIEVGEVPCILEGMVGFNSEVSLIAARSNSGEIAFYPLTENHHRDGILRTSIAPCDGTALQPLAETYMRELLTRLDYIGVLAIELFTREGKLIANEMAPRVHNSGHWTIEGAATSQFENHLRALLNLPLGSTASQPVVMLNCIGNMPSLEETARFPHLYRHDYGKEPRPGRKVGHLTFPASETAAIAYWKQRLDDV
ncbi:MAG: 5-(carboxyamino)imidazole ribonucleotide synthase [Janthinobacterium lividum]